MWMGLYRAPRSDYDAGSGPVVGPEETAVIHSRPHVVCGHALTGVAKTSYLETHALLLTGRAAHAEYVCREMWHDSSAVWC